MEEYKESGVDWIGKIPIEWEIKHFKNIVSLYNGNSISDSEKEYYEDSTEAYPYIATKDINANTNAIDYNNGLFVKKNDKSFKIAPKNSTLMCIEGGSAGRKKGFTNQKVAFVNKLCCFHSNSMNNKFIYYYLSSKSYIENFNQFLTGLIGGVSLYNLKQFYIVIPSINEQNMIADFLDEKIGKIDKILEDLNKQIDILKKYRNNIIYESTTYGIENTADLIYTDNIFYKKTHKNWHLVALKRLTKVLTCGVASTPEYTDKDNGILFLSAQNIQNNKLDLSTKNYIPSELHKKITKYTKPQYGDVLQVRVGATIGKSAIVDIKDEFSIYVSLTLMRVNEKINNKYLNYVISTDQFKQMVSLDVDFAGSQGNLNVGDLKETKIPLPDYKEQIKIINYLDEKCSNIDKTIQIKQKQIDKLENYKKSLIYEYVTGKKRVKEE